MINKKSFSLLRREESRGKGDRQVAEQTQASLSSTCSATAQYRHCVKGSVHTNDKNQHVQYGATQMGPVLHAEIFRLLSSSQNYGALLSLYFIPSDTISHKWNIKPNVRCITYRIE